MRAALVIRTAGLEVRSSKAPPPDHWYWTRPAGLEDLVHLRSAADLLEYRRRQSAPEPSTQPQLTRAALIGFERLLASAAELQSPTDAVVECLAAVTASLPDSLAIGGRAISDVLRGKVQSSDRKAMALNGAAEWVRRIHRLYAFAPGPSATDADYAAFLRASLKIDKQLALGETIRIALVARRARLSEEAADLCAARALEEKLAYVSDIDPQPYALQIEDEEAQEELTRLESLHRSAPASSGQPERVRARRRVDIAIITIRDDEFEAVLDVFPEPGEPHRVVGVRSQRHYNIRVADAGAGNSYLIGIVRQVTPGNGEGQALARDCIEDLDPSLILVVGIAGAPPKNDLTLGDVLFSTHVHDFTVRAHQPGAPDAYSIGGGPMASSIARGVANLKARKADLGEWWSGLPERPGVRHDVPSNYTSEDVDWNNDIRNSLEHHFVRLARGAPLFMAGPLGASDALVKDPEVIKSWLKTARSLCAVEMESCGVYHATRERTAMLAIRGISDVVGFKRDESWTAYACKSAAQMARAYLRTTPVAITAEQDVGR